MKSETLSRSAEPTSNSNLKGKALLLWLLLVVRLNTADEVVNESGSE
jgi:hypothetical protein